MEYNKAYVLLDDEMKKLYCNEIIKELNNELKRLGTNKRIQSWSKRRLQYKNKIKIEHSIHKFNYKKIVKINGIYYSWCKYCDDDEKKEKNLKFDEDKSKCDLDYDEQQLFSIKMPDDQLVDISSDED